MSRMAQVDLKKKLTTEYLGIAHRVNRLTDFISSPDYDSLDTEHRLLLFQQYQAMSTYRDVLQKRLKLLDISGEQGTT